MTRSATPAPKTERTITNLVLTIEGAHRAETSLTHASMCERRMALNGRSPNGTDPTARSALARVDGSQS